MVSAIFKRQIGIPTHGLGVSVFHQFILNDRNIRLCRFVPVGVGWADFGLFYRGEVFDVERSLNVDRDFGLLSIGVGGVKVAFGHTLRPFVPYFLLSWRWGLWQFFVVLSILPVALNVEATHIDVALLDQTLV